MNTRTLSTSRAARLALLGLCLASFALPALAAPRSSNSYTAPAEALNSAGPRGTSAAYTHDGDLDMLGTGAASASYTLGGGFRDAVQDTTGPALTVPATQIVEATGPGGATVTFTPAPTASDDEDGPLTPVSTPASGTLFALGDTTVQVSATDLTGNAMTGSFLVRVRDTTKPVVATHAEVTVTATSTQGAVVNYAAATATDAVTTSPAITYSQNPGTNFPIGTTVVTIFAQDAAGNIGAGTFAVTVAAQKTTLPTGTGDGVPGAGIAGSGVPAGAQWRTFGIPGNDDDGSDSGVPVFLGTFGSPTASPAKALIATGIFGLGGSTALLAKTGDLAADTDAATFGGFNEPVGNDGTAFIGSVKDHNGKLVKATAGGVWSNAFPDTDGGLHLVARAGSPAADSGLAYKAIDALALNDGQNLFWNATLTGPAATNRALFLQSSRADGPHVVLQTGDSISGFDGVTVKSFIALHEGGNGGLAGVNSSFGTGRPNGGATTPVLVTFSDKSTAIFKVGLSTLDFVARTGTATPDITNGHWKTLGLPAAAGSTVAFRAVLAPVAGRTDVTKNNAAAIYADGPNHPLAAIARQGGAAGDAQHQFLAFSDPAVNANGDIEFFAQIVGPTGKTTALCLATDLGGIYAVKVLQQLGGAAPDLPGVLLSKFTGAALSQNFDPAVTQYPIFLTTLKSGTTKIKATENSALFAYDGTGTAHLLVRTGLQPNGKTLKIIGAFSSVLGSPGQSRATASSSHVIYRATYLDKTQAIEEVPMP